MINSFLILSDNESPHELKDYLEKQKGVSKATFSVISTKKGDRGLPPEAVEIVVNVISDLLSASIISIGTMLIARFKNKSDKKAEILIKEKEQPVSRIDIDKFPEGVKEDIKEIEFIGIKEK